MTHTPLIFWIVFNAVVLILLALDLLVFHRGFRGEKQEDLEAGLTRAAALNSG